MVNCDLIVRRSFVSNLLNNNFEMELETDDDQHSDASDDQHTDDDWHADDYFHVDDYYCYTDDYWHVDDNDWHIGPRNEWKLEVLPPVLQAVKDRFPPGSEWLWRRCNEILDPWGPNEMDITTHERARALNLVLHNPGRGALTPYPLRPSESLPSSESVDKLRAILAQAVRIPINADGEDEIDGLDRHETWDPEWDISYDWTMNYRDEVSEALFGVFKQHGAGEEGWASARWEVYDTVSFSTQLKFGVDTNCICINSMHSVLGGFVTNVGKGRFGRMVQNGGLLRWL